MKRIFLSASFLAVTVTAVLTYASGLQAELHNSLIRLHIIAHSDSEFDQSIKSAVRDAVLEATSGIDAADIEQFRVTAQDAANQYLKSRGIEYRAAAEYGEFKFPTKEYGTVSLPAGKYNGIRITLGSGNGHNWWCIMYPPLCVGEGDTAKEALRLAISDDAYETITKKPDIRFRILELMGK